MDVFYRFSPTFLDVKAWKRGSVQDYDSISIKWRFSIFFRNVISSSSVFLSNYFFLIEVVTLLCQRRVWALWWKISHGMSSQEFLGSSRLPVQVTTSWNVHASSSSSSSSSPASPSLASSPSSTSRVPLSKSKSYHFLTSKHRNREYGLDNFLAIFKMFRKCCFDKLSPIIRAFFNVIFCLYLPCQSSVFACFFVCLCCLSG